MRILSIPMSLLLSFQVAHATQDTFTPQTEVTGSRDQLKPSQVNYQGESSHPSNASGVFFGVSGSFGQAMPTNAGSPALAVFGSFEPGYQIETGSWSRLELSLELYSGKLGFRHDKVAGIGGKGDLPIAVGIMPKIGHGYSLGNNIMGIIKAGVGPAFARLELGDAKTEGQFSGLAAMLGWEMIAPVSAKLDFTAGLSYTHYQFDINDLELPGGDKIDYAQSLQLNAPQARLGLRLRI